MWDVPKRSLCALDIRSALEVCLKRGGGATCGMYPSAAYVRRISEVGGQCV